MRRIWLSLALALLVAGTGHAADDDPYARSRLGFAAYEQGDYITAAAEFEAALAIKLDLPIVWAQLGYTYRKLNRNDDAARAFRSALGHNVEGDRYAYRREVQNLENRFDTTAYVIYRESALSNAFLSFTGPSINQSQAGTELAWTPPRMGYRDGKLLQVYARATWAHDGNGFALLEDTLQGGAGVRYRPLQSHNLVVAAERLVAIGDDARNDWMLRASYSWDKGFDIRPQARHWTFATAYLDAALIDPGSADILLTAEGRYGHSWIMGGNGNGPTWSVTPHVVSAAFWQDDDFNTTTLMEAGPGVSVKLYFADSPASAHAGTLELLLQYRFKLTGDSLGGSSAVATLVLRY